MRLDVFRSWQKFISTWPQFWNKVGSICPAVSKTKKTREFSVTSLKSQVSEPHLSNQHISTNYAYCTWWISAKFLCFHMFQTFQYNVLQILMAQMARCTTTLLSCWSSMSLWTISNLLLDMTLQMLQSNLAHLCNKPEYPLYEKTVWILFLCVVPGKSCTLFMKILFC